MGHDIVIYKGKVANFETTALCLALAFAARYGKEKLRAHGAVDARLLRFLDRWEKAFDNPVGPEMGLHERISWAQDGPALAEILLDAEQQVRTYGPGVPAAVCDEVLGVKGTLVAFRSDFNTAWILDALATVRRLFNHDRTSIVGLIGEVCERFADARAIEEGGLRVRCGMELRTRSVPVDPRTPPDLADLWGAVREARLFEDADHGQWGLVLLSSEDSARETGAFRRDRARDRIEGDLVVGLFLGDQDRLVVRADPKADDYGRVLVALPLDRRSDWYQPAESLDAFVRAFIETRGAKFWTTGRLA
jgi:hypothetical protein